MQLTDNQDAALMAIKAWIAHGDAEFRLAGYAGTGKTTLIQYLLDSIDRAPFLACPTGKAAKVLEDKTKREVTTVHRLIYSPNTSSAEMVLRELVASLELHPEMEAELEPLIAEAKKDAEQEDLGFTAKDTPDITPGDLIVVDEASMVDEQMRADLLATGGRVLFVGDAGQLPPIKDQGFFEKHPPHIALEKVVRQALGSPIIRASMEIRAGAIPDIMGHGDGAQFIRTPKGKFDFNRYLATDQVLTGKNATRRQLNRWIRMNLGHYPSTDSEEDGGRMDWMPATGEKLICLKNDRTREPAMINGALCSALSPGKVTEDGRFVLGLLYDGRAVEDVEAYDHPFLATYREDAPTEPYFARRHLVELDFAYAITVHKSQGSEWGSVILCDDEMQRHNTEFRKRWLYTGITRAKTKLEWVY